MRTLPREIPPRWFRAESPQWTQRVVERGTAFAPPTCRRDELAELARPCGVVLGSWIRTNGRRAAEHFGGVRSAGTEDSIYSIAPGIKVNPFGDLIISAAPSSRSTTRVYELTSYLRSRSSTRSFGRAVGLPAGQSRSALCRADSDWTGVFRSLCA